MDSNRLFDTVLENSRQATRAIEETKQAMVESARASGQVAETLRKVAETNEKQTEVIQLSLEQRSQWEKEKEEIKAIHAQQLAEVKAVNAKLQKILIVLALLLFIGVGGYTLLEKLHSLGALAL